MTAVIFETLSLKSAANCWLKLYGHQAAPRRAAGRAIPLVQLGNGLRSGMGLANCELGENLRCCLRDGADSIGQLPHPQMCCSFRGAR